MAILSVDLVQQVVSEMRLPSLSLYGGDWMRDPVSSCSIAAQGLWFRLLLAMHDAKPYGHLVGNNGQPLSEKAIARSCGVTVEQLRKLRSELEEVGVPGRTGDRDYEPIFLGADVNGEPVDLSPLRISIPGVLYSRRLIKDQRLRVIRRLVTILGKPKFGRLTGQTLGQNAERDAGGRAANENETGSASLENHEEESSRALTPQQQAVKDVEIALEEQTTGFALPDAARLAKEIKTYSLAHILDAIREEGPKATLDGRNWSYLHQILESRRRNPVRRTAAPRPSLVPQIGAGPVRTHPTADEAQDIAAALLQPDWPRHDCTREQGAGWMRHLREECGGDLSQAQRLPDWLKERKSA